jgi:hypothetical protein
MRLACALLCVAACGHPFDVGPDATESGVDAHDSRAIDGAMVSIDAAMHDAAMPDMTNSNALAIEPAAIHMPAGRDQPFVASAAVTWSVMEAGGGTIDAAGMYIAPDVPGTYHVLATDA